MAKNIQKLFPIQYHTFDAIYEGKNLVAKAKTGTGKTLSFVLPLLERLKKLQTEKSSLPVILTLAPTRELAQQVERDFREISRGSNIRSTCIYGASSYSIQEDTLRRGVDVVVGTPGRLADLVRRGSLNLSKINTLVCDEADEILKIGFQKELDFLIGKIPQSSQILLFSATVPNWVKDIAKNKMGNYELVDLVGDQKIKTSDVIDHYALFSHAPLDYTVDRLVKKYAPKSRTIVFVDRKQEASTIARSKLLSDKSEAIHGDITQAQRNRTLDGFRKKQFNVLVATDVAARGLDIPEVDLVIMLHPPSFPESYIHRSGRTGRAGRKGTCIVIYRKEEAGNLSMIEANAGVKFHVIGFPNNDKSGSGFRELEVMRESDVKPFLNQAERLLENHGSRILAAALSKLQPSQKYYSVLSGSSGLITLKYTSDDKLTVQKLKRTLGFAAEDASNITFTHSGKEAVFEVPPETAEELESIGIQRIESLPSDLSIPFKRNFSKTHSSALPKRDSKRIFERNETRKNHKFDEDFFSSLFQK